VLEEKDSVGEWVGELHEYAAHVEGHHVPNGASQEDEHGHDGHAVVSNPHSDLGGEALVPHTEQHVCNQVAQQDLTP